MNPAAEYRQTQVHQLNQIEIDEHLEYLEELRMERKKAIRQNKNIKRKIAKEREDDRLEWELEEQENNKCREMVKRRAETDNRAETDIPTMPMPIPAMRYQLPYPPVQQPMMGHPYPTPYMFPQMQSPYFYPGIQNPSLGQSGRQLDPNSNIPERELSVQSNKALESEN